MNEQEFRLAIMQLALCFCFGEDDEYLSLDQIIERGFSPIEAYTRLCINELVNNEVVEIIALPALISKGKIQGSTRFKRLIKHGKEMEQFVYTLSGNLIDVMTTSPEFEIFLCSLLEDLKACECIEYSMYYGKKSEINIINASIHDVKLRLLFLRCSQDEIQMLFWRAIKAISKASKKNSIILFSKITDAAFDYYVSYARDGIKIEGYHRPRILKPSVLSGILEMFCGNENRQ